jgi:hypothetical protein
VGDKRLLHVRAWVKASFILHGLPYLTVLQALTVSNTIHKIRLTLGVGNDVREKHV